LDSEEDEMSRRWPLRITLAAALCLPFLTPSAHAQDEEKRGFSLDLYGVYLSGTTHLGGDEEHQEGFGLRGSYRFNNVWALEGAVSQFSWDDADERLVEVSAKAYFVHSNYFEVYALAGVGHSRLEGFNDKHLGLGLEIPLGSRAYLRPEIRGRWDGIGGHEVEPEYSLGVGWRF
jgi:hypothetical protein